MFKSKSPASENRPPSVIAILGASPLALAAAARFQLAGDRVILLTDPAAAARLQNTGFMLREERSLIHRKFNFETAFHLSEKPDLLIIAADYCRLRSHITLLNPGHLHKVPVLNCNTLTDTAFLDAFLRFPAVKVFFEGLVFEDRGLLTIFSRRCLFHLALAENDPFFPILQKHLSRAGFETCPADSDKTFWQVFIPYAVASLLCGHRGKNIYQLCRDAKERRLIQNLTRELTDLAKTAGASLSAGTLAGKIFDMPSDYKLPAQSADPVLARAEICALSGRIMAAAEHRAVSMPSLRALLAQIHNKYLA